MSRVNLLTRLSNKITPYFRNIYLDYRDVFLDVQKSSRRRPIRSTLYASLLVTVIQLFRHNQGLEAYKGEVVSACTRMAAVVKEFRNPRSEQFVRTVGELTSLGHLRQIDLGFATLIYRAEANPDLALYRHNCSHLNPSLREFFQERVIDLGLLGRWFKLESMMIDYDINEQQLEDLQ